MEAWTMDRRLSDRRRQLLSSAETIPFVESYDEAVDLHFARDLRAWEKLLALHERFLLRAWEHPLPDEDCKIDRGH
jgi:hypothetical protein